MLNYPAIEDHGIVGDLQTAALVTLDGAIDWFCHPRFDSPSIFAGLLDTNRGGYFSVAPEDENYVSRQLYLPGTAILITRFMTEGGVGEVLDFMPVAGEQATAEHSIVRVVRVVRGEMRFVARCEPRFDYGRASHETNVTADGVVFTASDGTAVTLNIAPRPGHEGHPPAIERTEHGVRAVVTAQAGEDGGMILTAGGPPRPRQVTADEVRELLFSTRDFWRRWTQKSRYTGRWRESVERSAITLKLMTFAPTGALVAAPTAGLPEQTGGERNWDYRYTWVRDGSFSVYALLSLGYVDEARAFLGWLAARMHSGVHQNGSSPLKVMYRVDGSSDLSEEVLDHLDGWRNSKPVRIGNGASDQLQLDIYGEALDSVWLADRSGLQIAYEGWSRVRSLLDWLCDNWDQDDDGIWETRGGRQPFTYARAMSWVAFDRGLRLASARGLPGDVARWASQRDAVYDQIMQHGWNTEREAFTQHYKSDVLDAALLHMPTVGLVSPTDPRWKSTLAAMDEELVSDSLVYRYDPAASPDGLRGAEGTFSMCSFWYVDSLVQSGRIDEASLMFEKMLTYGNRLGLYSEEIGPTGEQLGNFPQAFSHLALISAAVNLDRALDSPTRNSHTGP